MFSKKPRVIGNPMDGGSSDTSGFLIELRQHVPKYPHPKILLVDTPSDVREALEGDGYNVSDGTFGTPYKVRKSSYYQPVIVKASLPNFKEQEIVIIDLVPGETQSGPLGEKHTPDVETDWWAKCSSGKIDPRPRAMAMVSNDFNRILDSGGTFVVFADDRIDQKLVLGRDAGYFHKERDLPYDNWSFLPVLGNLVTGSDHGEEITPVKDEIPIVRLLGGCLAGASFRCTLTAIPGVKSRWHPLAKNKYGATVAALIAPEKNKDGWIFIFPRIKEKARFLSSFLKDILPDLCPALFPHAEGQKWVHRSEYELSSVVGKTAQISAIQAEAARKVTELENAIEDERNSNRFLYDLIRETGEPLVEAIKKALALLGFKSVVDVDEEMKAAGKQAQLREDLRIHDTSPVLVVDIKGVAGTPADGESLQAQKHVYIYMKEQGRVDVSGLTIINHQRLIPPLERDNDMPYRQGILDNAEQQQLGLMTAWDLFRLVRGFIENNWKPEHVKPLFYKIGRILPVPAHYELVGKVEQVWKHAFSVEIEAGELNVGDRIAVEFPVVFNEQSVESLQLGNESVQTVAAKCEVGIRRPESLPKVKSGMNVFRIIAR